MDEPCYTGALEFPRSGNAREAKESILWGETPPEYAFVRGGGKSVDGVVEGCTPRNGKNKMLRYVFGE